MDTSIFAHLQAQELLTVQYLTVSSITLFLWDFLLVFPREASFIWSGIRKPGRTSKIRLAYIVSRYAFPIAIVLLVVAITLHHVELSNSWCSVTMTLAVLLVLLTELIWHCLLLVRVFVLWDRNVKLLYLIIAGIVTSYAVCIAFLVLLAKDLTLIAFVGMGLDVCASLHIQAKKVIGIELPQIILDLYALLLIAANALAIPRTDKRSLLNILKRDGSALIAMTWALRVTNVVLFLTTGDGPGVGLSKIVFTETLIAVINARLFFKLFADAQQSYDSGINEVARSPASTGGWSDDATEHLPMERLKL